MPRFFDDYSNTYLTHDSAAGRKQQRRGWKFRENFKLHYSNNLAEWQAGPMGLADKQQAFLRRHRNPASGQVDGPVPPLPEGWKEELDGATGAHFYVNEESGERSWVRPNFDPPGGPGGPPPPPANFRAPPPQFQQPHPPNNQFNRPPPAFPPPPGQGPPPGMGIPPPRFAPPPSMPPPAHHGMPPPNFPPPPPPPGAFQRPS
eukprot:CAMPEP_0201721130 /NCGR_PEP_ID=MMETSP0593-20130828/5880_1 /ASSEMBLY_ACC=CAM_ASM_000672 /TAXON_ID=267983 /ORGANISM="Skeletonema japonicum, Strain CCMP2506" /LENGTH=202 /DNA_ID=CAMNT_0048211875 /DNA_START=199 /DNA_END=807 /DNA_ORIENTATION=-